MEALSAARPTDAKLALVAARGQLMLGDHAAFQGDMIEARAAWERGASILQWAASPASPLKDRASLQLLGQIGERMKSGVGMGCE